MWEYQFKKIFKCKSLKHPKVSDKLFKRALWTILVLQLLDILTTFTFLTMGRGEGNPIFKWLINQSFTLGITIKVFSVMLILFGFYVVYYGLNWKKNVFTKSKTWLNIDYALNATIIICMYVVTHNIVGIVLDSLGVI